MQFLLSIELPREGDQINPFSKRGPGRLGPASNHNMRLPGWEVNSAKHGGNPVMEDTPVPVKPDDG